MGEELQRIIFLGGNTAVWRNLPSEDSLAFKMDRALQALHPVASSQRPSLSGFVQR